MTPLERAALAIFEHCSRRIEERAYSPEALLLAWEEAGGSNREKWIEAARAVLLAIREPGEAMKEAGWNSECVAPDGSPNGVWQAMIDAALEEG